jgi:uncharacterized protein YegJ (DUF2314 family)
MMDSDRPVPFDSEDEEMELAIYAAKHSFGDFLAAYSEPKSGQEGFLVKVAFIDGEDVEHIWVADLEFVDMHFRGVIANEPSLRSLHFMQPVEFEPPQITDWMYIENGRLVGGYTTRLIRQRMSAEERAALDAMAPYTFGE